MVAAASGYVVETVLDELRSSIAPQDNQPDTAPQPNECPCPVPPQHVVSPVELLADTTAPGPPVSSLLQLPAHTWGLPYVATYVFATSSPFHSDDCRRSRKAREAPRRLASRFLERLAAAASA